MTVNLRRDAWTNEQQFDAIRQMSMDIDNLRILVGLTRGNAAGVFTPAWAGFSAAPAGDMAWVRIAGIVFLFPSDNTGRLGTSNAIGMSFTGMPSDILPTGGRDSPVFLSNNTVNIWGSCNVGPAGSAVFSVWDTAGIANKVGELAGGFTAAGTKGLRPGAMITYHM